MPTSPCAALLVGGRDRKAAQKRRRLSWVLRDEQEFARQTSAHKELSCTRFAFIDVNTVSGMMALPGQAIVCCYSLERSQCVSTSSVPDSHRIFAKLEGNVIFLIL